MKVRIVQFEDIERVHPMLRQPAHTCRIPAIEEALLKGEVDHRHGRDFTARIKDEIVLARIASHSQSKQVTHLA